jgi:hypothetical protein
VLLIGFVLVYGSKRVVFVRLCIGVAREYRGGSLTYLAIAIGWVISKRHLTWWWAVPPTAKTGDILSRNYLTKLHAT